MRLKKVLMFLVAIFLLINLLDNVFKKVIGIFKKNTYIIIRGLFSAHLKERLGTGIDIINNQIFIANNNGGD
jgi:hypothetical protein